MNSAKLYWFHRFLVLFIMIFRLCTTFLQKSNTIHQCSSYKNKIIKTKWVNFSTLINTDIIEKSSYVKQADEIPILADFEFKQIKLKNGILATLIHDGISQKASCCLGVAAGAKDDPVQYPGLAHFTG